jgi:hypothetical protein
MTQNVRDNILVDMGYFHPLDVPRRVGSILLSLERSICIRQTTIQRDYYRR